MLLPWLCVYQKLHWCLGFPSSSMSLEFSPQSLTSGVMSWNSPANSVCVGSYTITLTDITKGNISHIYNTTTNTISKMVSARMISLRGRLLLHCIWLACLALCLLSWFYASRRYLSIIESFPNFSLSLKGCLLWNKLGLLITCLKALFLCSQPSTNIS